MTPEQKSRRNNEVLTKAFALMGLDRAEFERLLTAPTLEDVQRGLDAWRADVAKPAYKRAVMTHHPDRGGSHEDIVILTEGWEIIESLKPAPKPQPMMVRRIRIVYAGSEYSSTSTTTASTWPYFWPGPNAV